MYINWSNTAYSVTEQLLIKMKGILNKTIDQQHTSDHIKIEYILTTVSMQKKNTT